MRLLRTYSGPYAPGNEELKLLTFNRGIPKYAILSHVWGEDEVVFENIRDGTARHHVDAYGKITSAIAQAANDGHDYIWIDSCCIDKSSSAELQEAINSMYAWYRDAEVCYAILEDVPELSASNFEYRFEKSKWFARGWTLQELLAPRQLQLFGKCKSGAWTLLGRREELKHLISKITSIDSSYLTGSDEVHAASIAERMSWAAKRTTTRNEDVSYSLLGLFSVNMPLLYGEGSQRAFRRLQEEIMKLSDDHSIFAWIQSSTRDQTCHFEDIDQVLDLAESIRENKENSWRFPWCSGGLLARSPAAFAESAHIKPVMYPHEKQVPYHMTNRGLSINLKLTQLIASPDETICLAELDCILEYPRGHLLRRLPLRSIGIYLQQSWRGQNQYVRVRTDRLAMLGVSSGDGIAKEIFIRQPFC